MSAGATSRRGLLGLVAAATGGLVARAAVGETPVPVAPVDPTRVLGPGITANAARSPFEPPLEISPTGLTTGTAFSPIQDFTGTITPTDAQFQRHHAGIAMIDPATWKLLVHGLVQRPLAFTLDDIKRFPSVTRVHFLECAGAGRKAFRERPAEISPQFIDGQLSNVEYTGVELKRVLAEAGLKPDGKWLLAEAGDAALLARSLPVEKALDDALLVYAANGEPLRPAHGYPVRLLLPGWEANMSIKWLRRLEVTDQPTMTKDETSKYTDPLPGDRARYFSWVMDAKSIITSPSFPARLDGPGFHEVTGLAWSGRGRIARVEVSTDGGATWFDTELQGANTPKSVVRFVHPWTWDGQATVLMSRAVDETGYVQPSYAEFLAARGAGTDFHFNPIRSWRVGSDGAVTFLADPEAA